jgi:DNA (cytosine-5)-methyltransferase 1
MDAHNEDLGIIENTEGFLKWRLFDAWKYSLGQLGYSVSTNIVNAADLGVPQSRERVFFILTKSKNPIEISLPEYEPVTARSFIDLNFDGHNWDLVSNKVPATQLRVANGRKKYGDVFLDASYGSARTGRSIDKPLGTVTTVNKHYLVMGEYIRPLNVKELATAQSFSDDYIWPKGVTDTKAMIGNAVPPAMAKEVTLATLRAF